MNLHANWKVEWETLMKKNIAMNVSESSCLSPPCSHSSIYIFYIFTVLLYICSIHSSIHFTAIVLCYFVAMMHYSYKERIETLVAQQWHNFCFIKHFHDMCFHYASVKHLADSSGSIHHKAIVLQTLMVVQSLKDEEWKYLAVKFTFWSLCFQTLIIVQILRVRMEELAWMEKMTTRVNVWWGTVAPIACNVSILLAKKKNPGKSDIYIHIQLCCRPTGQANKPPLGHVSSKNAAHKLRRSLKLMTMIE